jgi:alpha-glucosidase
LPAGEWVDFYTGQRYRSRGAWFGPFPTWAETPQGARFRLPLFARAGAIVPQMHVDERTMNALGRRTDGTVRDELVARVYADETRSAFTLYEDDGRTVAYQRGEVRTTPLSQVQAGGRVTVTIGGASGEYAGAPGRRGNVIDLFVESADEMAEVRLTVGLSRTVSLQRHATLDALDAAPSGWTVVGPHQIAAKSGELDVAVPKVFTFVRLAADQNRAAQEELHAFLPTVLCVSEAGGAGSGSRIYCPLPGYLPLVVRVR